MNPIKEALMKLPNGARFYRCALQVNPYEYLVRTKKQTAFKDEASYNSAIVKACNDHGIEVIAITDHYRVASGARLAQAARDAAIHVFPGFEAVTKDGVHILCLFDPNADAQTLERRIGDCGIHSDIEESPVGHDDTVELLEKARNWGAVCIAAHVAAGGGLLGHLKGQPRVNAWRSEHLSACSLPGAVSGLSQDARQIVENKNPDYKRERPVAVLNAQDVSSPDDLAKGGSWCWIKMSNVSVDGLRQAFLDPESRIRLSSAPVPDKHAELAGVTWQTEGFLSGAAIHFNENLNVLVGGRGAGKSTVIESLRYVLGLDPVGEDAKRAHDGIMQNVVGSGTKISLLVRSHSPASREYLIERTRPNPPIVKDENGTVLSLLPKDVIPGLEVYGQHEISELTKLPEKITRLLERFVEGDSNLARRKLDVKRGLEKSRASILDVMKEQKLARERLESLPALEEMLKRFQEAGLEEKLKEQSLLVREERVLKTAGERVAPFKELLEQLRRALPIDRAFLSARALSDLPGRETIAKADEVLDALNLALAAEVDRLAEAIRTAEKDLSAVRQDWEARRKEVQAAYEEKLRELQRDKVDGEEFIRLRRQIEELRPLKEREAVLVGRRKELEGQRRSLLVEWQEIKRDEYQRLERAARSVTGKLADRVSAKVVFEGNREPLYDVLRNRVGGQLAKAIDALRGKADFSLQAFADDCRRGAGSLRDNFGLPQGAAERIAQAAPDVFMEVEELELPHPTIVKLNVSPEGETPAWKRLDELSTGQKATAVLLLLLLESDAPLIVDQPEDDLDNRFITDGVVPKMREEKRRRQFVFATHNANIPVLGDAELIVGLTAAAEAGQEVRARMPVEHMGSIDSPTVRALVEEVLEGGQEAFEMRRAKYGF